MVNFHIHHFQPGGAVVALQALFAHARALQPGFYRVFRYDL